MTLGRVDDKEERQVPEGPDDSQHQARSTPVNVFLHYRQCIAAPSELLAQWASYQKDKREVRHCQQNMP